MDTNQLPSGYKLHSEEIGALFCRNNDLSCFVVAKITRSNAAKAKITFVNREIKFPQKQGLVFEA